MSSARRLCLVAASLFVAFVLAACENPRTPQTVVEATRPPAQKADPGTSPVNERDRLRAAAWAEAIDGLGFDTGLVVVEQPPAAADLDRARRMIAQGDAHVQLNRRTPAVKAYADAVKAAPALPASYLALGKALIFKGKTDLAIAAFRTAVRLDGQALEPRVRLANALAMATRRDEAIAEMNAVIALDPAHGPAHERLAVWHYYADDHAKAWDHVHAAREIDHPMPPQFITLLEKRMADPGAG